MSEARFCDRCKKLHPKRNEVHSIKVALLIDGNKSHDGSMRDYTEPELCKKCEQELLDAYHKGVKEEDE